MFVICIERTPSTKRSSQSAIFRSASSCLGTVHLQTATIGLGPCSTAWVLHGRAHIVPTG